MDIGKSTLQKNDRQKGSLFCHYGTFQYLRIRLGLTNAPEIIQRALELILISYIWNIT